MAGWLGRAGLACALAAALALPASAQTKGGAITYAAAGGIGSLDPHVSGSIAELEAIHHIFEPLVTVDESYNARPMLAASIQVGDEAARLHEVDGIGLITRTEQHLTCGEPARATGIHQRTARDDVQPRQQRQGDQRVVGGGFGFHGLTYVYRPGGTVT